MRPLAVLCALASCGWGEIEYITFTPVHGSDSAGTRTAIVSHYVEQQPPTGLGAFPDGGKPRELLRGALVYLCDARASRVNLLGAVEEKNSEFNVTPAIGNWDTDGFVVAIGRATAPIVYSMTRISADGAKSAVGVSEVPPASNQHLTPYCATALDSISRDIQRRSQDNYRRKP